MKIHTLTPEEKKLAEIRKNDLLEILDYIDRDKANSLKKVTTSVSEIKTILEVAVVSLKTEMLRLQRVNNVQRKSISIMGGCGFFNQY